MWWSLVSVALNLSTSEFVSRREKEVFLFSIKCFVGCCSASLVISITKEVNMIDHEVVDQQLEKKLHFFKKKEFRIQMLILYSWKTRQLSSECFSTLLNWKAELVANKNLEIEIEMTDVRHSGKKKFVDEAQCVKFYTGRSWWSNVYFSISRHETLGNRDRLGRDDVVRLHLH